MKKYLYHYDCLRTLACILIVGIHVTDGIVITEEIFNYQWWFKIISQTIFRVGLPVFFILSGALILNNKEEKLSSFYKKRFIKIGVPLLLFSLFYLFINKYGTTIFEPSTFIVAIKQILAKYVEGHLWFVYTILGLYIVVPFIKVMLNNLSDKMLIDLIVLIIIIRIIYTYLPAIGINIGISKIMFFSWLDYFIVGYFLTKDISTIYYKKIEIAGFISFILSIFILRNLPNFNIGLYDMSPTMFFMASTLFIIFEKNRTVINSNKKWYYPIHILSKYSFTIYLIHRYVLDNILNSNGINASFHGIILGTTITIVLTLIISLFIAIVVDNIIMNPIIKFLKEKLI